MRWTRPVLLALALLTGGGAGAATTNFLTGITAVVNDSVITATEVFAFSRRALQTAARRAGTQTELDQEVTRIQTAALEQLVERRLIVQEYNSRPPEQRIPESILDDFLKQDIKKEYGDMVNLLKELRLSGRTYESYRQEAHDALIMGQMIQMNIAQDIVISPKKIERVYQTNQAKYRVNERAKVRMILIDVRQHARGEPAKLASEALARVKGGEDFAKVADELSDDARSNKGGERGWIERGQTTLDKRLMDVVFSLAAGQVSDPVDLGGSFFLIKVEESRPAQVKPISEVRLEIENQLRLEERARRQKSWIGRLRRKAFVTFF